MKKIVLFGDSLMTGLQAGETTDLLDNYTKDSLAGMGFPDYQIKNLGVRGDSSVDGLQRVAEAVAEKPDYIAILFGDNDAISQVTTPEEYAANLEKIISAFDSEKVIVLSPTYLDMALRTEGDNERQQVYVAAAEKVAAAKGVNFINLYHHMTVYPYPDEFLQADGLHPSDEGYHFIGALIARDIKNKLLA